MNRPMFQSDLVHDGADGPLISPRRQRWRSAWAIALLAIVLALASPTGADAARRKAAAPGAASLPPGGNTIAGPGGFDLEPTDGSIVFRSSNNPFCVTLSVDSPDVLVRMNVAGLNTLYVTSAASQSICTTVSSSVEIICDESSLANCAGHWRIDHLP